MSGMWDGVLESRQYPDRTSGDNANHSVNAMYTNRHARKLLCFGVALIFAAVGLTLLSVVMERASPSGGLVGRGMGSDPHWHLGLVIVGAAVASGVLGVGLIVAGAVGRAILPPFEEGVCGCCGYDLRGQIERRCPECGMAF